MLVRITVFYLLLVGVLCAHKMDSFYLHFEYSEKSWEAEMRFDAGYATPELRAVPEAPPPTVEWMNRKSEEYLSKMRAEMISFVFEQFDFFQGEEKVNWKIEVPGFMEPPYEYEYSEEGGVFFFLKLSADFDGESPLIMRVSDDCDIPVAVGIPNRRQEDGRDIYMIQAGNKHKIITPGTNQQPIPIGVDLLNQEEQNLEPKAFVDSENISESLDSEPKEIAKGKEWIFILSSIVGIVFLAYYLLKKFF